MTGGEIMTTTVGITSKGMMPAKQAKQTAQHIREQNAKIVWNAIWNCIVQKIDERAHQGYEHARIYLDYQQAKTFNKNKDMQKQLTNLLKMHGYTVTIRLESVMVTDNSFIEVSWDQPQCCVDSYGD